MINAGDINEHLIESVYEMVFGKGYFDSKGMPYSPFDYELYDAADAEYVRLMNTFTLADLRALLIWFPTQSGHALFKGDSRRKAIEASCHVIGACNTHRYCNVNLFYNLILTIGQLWTKDRLDYDKAISGTMAGIDDFTWISKVPTRYSGMTAALLQVYEENIFPVEVWMDIECEIGMYPDIDEALYEKKTQLTIKLSRNQSKS